MKGKIIRKVTLTIVAGAFLMLWSLAYAVEQPVEKHAQKQETAAETITVDEKPSTDEAVSVLVEVPFFSTYFDGVPLASVDDEQITVLDLRKALMSVHEKMADQKEKAAKKSFLETLDRLINARLAVHEAKNIELDKLPEIKADLDENAEKQLRQVLFQDRVKDIKPDEKEVEKLYREMAREWKLKSIAFHKKADAEKFKKDLKEGKSFDELRDAAIKSGIAVQAGQNEELYANKASLGPVLGEEISLLKVGSVSPVIGIPNAFAVVKVEDVRNVEDPELKVKAQAQVLSSMRLASLKKYKDELYKKFVNEKTALLKKIDFESAKPGIAKLLKDKRVIATIKGEKPITVAEIAKEIRGRYYHGVEGAIKKKKVNRDKFQVLDDMISQRVFKKEALERGLDRSQEYLSAIKDYENSVLFGTFVEKVVKPDVTINSKDVQDYYDAHVAEYVFPAMFQIDDVAFKSGAEAQAAIDKLRQGMDFKWLKNNADNQVEKDNPALLNFGGQVLSVKSFPEQLQKALAGADTGDYRYYAAPEGIYYALHVEKAVPPRTQTFDEVKNDIAQKIAWQNFSKDLEEWFKKLREAYPVKVYLQEK